MNNIEYEVGNIREVLEQLVATMKQIAATLDKIERFGLDVLPRK